MTDITAEHRIEVCVQSTPILRDVKRIAEKYNIPDSAEISINGWDITFIWEDK